MTAITPSSFSEPMPLAERLRVSVSRKASAADRWSAAHCLAGLVGVSFLCWSTILVLVLY